jgi:magnesium chelatase family protein
MKRITISLSPAETVKSGTHYDLAIAAAILKATGILPDDDKRAIYFGELNLSGEVKWIRGILPMVIEALCSFDRIFIPADNLQEVLYLNDPRIIPVRFLSDLCNPEQSDSLKYVEMTDNRVQNLIRQGDFNDIRGQSMMIEGFKIAAAGHHHMLLIGPPGSGKTMASSRLPGILPDLENDEILETNKIYSIALESPHRSWITSRPFRTPHNSASSRAVIGGGEKILPGEISLAHKGILFLDEFIEFRSDTLQSLRTVIEKKEVYISLRNGCAVYPADFMLIAAANPCPCGFYDSDGICSCSLGEVKKYRRKIKNPLTDRIDLQVKVERINYKNLMEDSENQSSADMKKEVLNARRIQSERYRNEPFRLNADIPPEKISYYCLLEKGGNQLLESFMETNMLTARACHKILRLARTIADIKQSDRIQLEHLEKAMKFRFLDLEVF